MSGGRGRERPRVLLVDDQASIREIFGTALRDAGFDVHAATTAGEALEALSRYRYDVIVADYGLPDIPGADLLAALMTAAPTTPRILCSDDLTDEVAAEAQTFGVTTVLAKPVSLSQLVETVRQGLAPG